MISVPTCENMSALGGTRTPNLLIRSYRRTAAQVRKTRSGMHADGLGRWPCVVEVAVLAAVSTFRFSGGCPGPRTSTAVRLSRPDDASGHRSVHDRPQVSTAVVSTALAGGADPDRLTLRFLDGASRTEPFLTRVRQRRRFHDGVQHRPYRNRCIGVNIPIFVASGPGRPRDVPFGSG